MALHTVNVGPDGYCDHELEPAPLLNPKGTRGVCHWGHGAPTMRQIQVDTEAYDEWYALGQARFSQPNGWSWDG
jgi:hypothetical protein